MKKIIYLIDKTEFELQKTAVSNFLEDYDNVEKVAEDLKSLKQQIYINSNRIDLYQIRFHPAPDIISPYHIETQKLPIAKYFKGRFKTRMYK